MVCKEYDHKIKWTKIEENTFHTRKRTIEWDVKVSKVNEKVKLIYWVQLGLVVFP